MIIILSSAVAAALCAALVFWALGRYTALPGPVVMFCTLLVLLLVYAAAPAIRIGG